MIKVRCDGCGKTIGASEKHAGKTARCPSCKAAVQIPAVPVVEVETVQDPLAYDPLAELPPVQDPNDPLGLGADQQVGDPFGGHQGGQVIYSKPKNVAAQIRKKKSTKNVLKKSKKDSPPEQDLDLDETFAGLFAAFGMSLVGIVVWVVYWFNSNEAYFFIFPIGILIGVLAGVVAKNSSPVFGSLCATLCFLVFLGAKALMAVFVMLGSMFVHPFEDFEDFHPDHFIHTYAIRDKMLDENRFNDEQAELARYQVESYFNNQTESFAENENWWNLDSEVTKMVDDRLASTPNSEKRKLLERAIDKYPQWIREEFQYYGVLHLLWSKGEIKDPDLSQQAEARLRSLTGEFPEYLRTVSQQDMVERDNRLKKMAGQKHAALSIEERDDALRGAIKYLEIWIANPDEYYAVMASMLEKRLLMGAMKEHGEAEIAQNVYPGYSNYFDKTAPEVLNERSVEIKTLVNMELIQIPQAGRRSLVRKLKTEYPFWEGGKGIDLEEAEVVEEGPDRIISDGTFVGSFWAVLSWMDAIFLALGMVSAFFIAQRWGYVEVDYSG